MKKVLSYDRVLISIRMGGAFMPTEWLQSITTGLSETLVYVAIALVTLTGLIKCIYPVLRNGSLLNRAVMKLEKSASSGERPIWREPRFIGRALRAEWQRFLVNAGQLDMRGMPCAVADYINEDTVVYKPGHSQLSELLPSLLTSLGILGTFMGMMEGLSDLDFSNAAGTIESIPSLLSGMRFAFATSVAGIACSLTFNILNRFVVGRAFKALDSFEDAFYELAMPRPLETDVQLLCQRQDSEQATRRIAETVGNQLAGTMEIAISRSLHPLMMSMDNFMQGATREQVEGVQHIVRQFVQQMNASLSGQFAALAETLGHVNEGQLATQENLTHTTQIAERLTEDTTRIQQAAHQLAQSMENDAESEQRMSTLRGMQALQEETAGSLRALTECVAHLSESIDRMDPTAAQARAAETLQAEVETLTSSTAEMTAAVDELVRRVSQLKPTERGIRRWLASRPNADSSKTEGA